MSSPAITRAVILARGLGTRMRREDAGAQVDAEQAAVADTGVKAMIPVGRPFLDFALSALADAGIEEVCLVVAPEHDLLRDRYTRELPVQRVRLHFAVQEAPRGTADAVLAAEDFVQDAPFLVLNSHNYYAPADLRALRRAPAPALLAYDREGLLHGGNIDAARIAAFALLLANPDGTLRRIVEKPDAATLQAVGEAARVSMNCWAFTSDIFAACRAIEPSARGELEIPHAVQYGIERMGMRFQLVPTDRGVLDLSSRGDIAAVTERLRDVAVQL